MLPFLRLSYGWGELWLPTNDVLIWLSAGAALWIAHRSMRAYVPLPRTALLLMLVLAGAILGGRLFHVLWERPALLDDGLSRSLGAFDGMTFYGALFAGALVLHAGLRLLVAPVARVRCWDAAAVAAAFGVGVLRIGCLANGCCWGSLCRYPWAIRYFDPDSVMPYLGIPVHPVQVYESLGGFMTFGLLIHLSRSSRVPPGYLAPIFLVAYGVVRFVTEGFRGDAFRGENVLLGLSTSQVISAALVVMVTLVAVREARAARQSGSSGLRRGMP